MAGVPDGDDQQRGRAWGTAPVDLESLVAWGIDRGLHPVAMESTGVSWRPRGETLAARALQGCLLRAASMTPVPGHQSAVRDCPWIQTLHRDG